MIFHLFTFRLCELKSASADLHTTRAERWSVFAKLRGWVVRTRARRCSSLRTEQALHEEQLIIANLDALWRGINSVTQSPSIPNEVHCGLLIALERPNVMRGGFYVRMSEHRLDE